MEQQSPSDVTKELAASLSVMFQRFEKLHATFDKDEARAMQIASPNADDTLEIKMAVVGFSYYSPTEKWGWSEFRIVADEMATVNGFSERERRFYALGMGYVLGMYLAGQLKDLEFRHAMIALPGFIFEKGGEI